MIKNFLFIVILFAANLSYGQSNVSKEDFEKQISILKGSENAKLKLEISKLSASLLATKQIIDSLKTTSKANENELSKTKDDLGQKISATETSTNQKFMAVNDSLSKTSLWSIIGILLAVIVSALLYLLASKRQKSDKTDVEAQISKTKKSLEEEGVKLDTKLTEILETQLKLVQEERNKMPANRSDDIDHSLALKVADEIVRINKNLSNMDGNIKGLKQLSASVKRIEDNFAASGYDMPEILNKPFDPRMKMIANMVEDESLASGVEIITKIIKPQVNFKGVQIQSAQVEVSVGQ
jgi:hypothetical protein